MFFGRFASAQTTGPQTAQQVINVVKNFAPWLFGLLLTIAVIFLVVAAYAYLTSEGDAEKTTTAKRMILYTVIAIAAAAFSRAIPALVEEITGLSAATPAANVNIGNVTNQIVGWLFGLLLVLAAAFILYAAFLFLTSGGNEEKVTTAKRFLVYAVVAIGVAALSRGIVAIVRDLLNV